MVENDFDDKLLSHHEFPIGYYDFGQYNVIEGVTTKTASKYARGTCSCYGLGYREFKHPTAGAYFVACECVIRKLKKIDDELAKMNDSV